MDLNLISRKGEEYEVQAGTQSTDIKNCPLNSPNTFLLLSPLFSSLSFLLSLLAPSANAHEIRTRLPLTLFFFHPFPFTNLNRKQETYHQQTRTQTHNRTRTQTHSQDRRGSTVTRTHNKKTTDESIASKKHIQCQGFTTTAPWSPVAVLACPNGLISSSKSLRALATKPWSPRHNGTSVNTRVCAYPSSFFLCFNC